MKSQVEFGDMDLNYILKMDLELCTLGLLRTYNLYPTFPKY